MIESRQNKDPTQIIIQLSIAQPKLNALIVKQVFLTFMYVYLSLFCISGTCSLRFHPFIIFIPKARLIFRLRNAVLAKNLIWLILKYFCGDRIELACLNNAHDYNFKILI